MIALALALGLSIRQAPVVFSGRLDAVLKRLADTGRIERNCVCSGALRDIPVSITLRSDRPASAGIARLLNAEWQPAGESMVLVRTQQAQRQLEQRQNLCLKTGLEALIQRWSAQVHEVTSNPATLGYRIQQQLDEYVRTGGRSSRSMTLPLDAIRMGCCLDVGSSRLASLGLDDYIYLSSVVDGVHEPLGPRARAAVAAYRRALDEPSVREALRKAQTILPAGNSLPSDVDKARVIVWITRVPAGVASWVWLYSVRGELLDYHGSLDPIRAPTATPLDRDSTVSLSPMTHLTVGAMKAGKVGGGEELRRRLVAGRSASLLDSFGGDVCASISAARHADVYMILDEQWLPTWIPLCTGKTASLRGLVDACSGEDALSPEIGDTGVFVRPALQVDAEAMIVEPEVLQRYMSAAFSTRGAALEDMCRLAAGIDTFSAYQFGILPVYSRIALSEGGRFTEDAKRSDFYVLRALAPGIPFPTQPNKAVALAVPAIPVARLAVASPLMLVAEGSSQFSELARRSSIYTDRDIASMPWDLTRLEGTYLAIVGPGSAPAKAYHGMSFAEPLAHLLLGGSWSPADLGNYPVFIGQGSEYRVRVAIGKGVTLETAIGQEVRWAAESRKLGDVPQGAELIKEAVALAERWRTKPQSPPP